MPVDIREVLERQAAAVPAPQRTAEDTLSHVRRRVLRARLRRNGVIAMLTIGVVVGGLVGLTGHSPRRVTIATSPRGVQHNSTSLPRSTTPLSDVLAGLPDSGLILLDSLSGGSVSSPPSALVSLFDNAGKLIVQLPRQTITNDVWNSSEHVLDVTSQSAGIRSRPVTRRSDDPTGCTTTGLTSSVRVATCGTVNGNQLLGDRLIVRRNGRWGALIEQPPAPDGVQVNGHWTWATTSPDGRSVLAQWSGECEIPTAFVISITGRMLRALTGETGAGWTNAPPSTALGWSADGRALATFGGESGCGPTTTIRRGVYAVSPADGSRHLILPLTAPQHALAWHAVTHSSLP
jgi:hypothetical protein